MTVWLVTFLAVSLAPLVLWVKVGVVCAAVLLLDAAVLRVAMHRRSSGARASRAATSALSLLVVVSTATLMAYGSYWKLSLDASAARDQDFVSFLIGLCTVSGWLISALTVATVLQGAFALLVRADWSGIDADAAAQWPERAAAEAPVSATPMEPRESMESVGAAEWAQAAPADEAMTSWQELSPWMEVFLTVNIVNLALLALTLFVRGPEALAVDSMLHRDVSAGITIGAAVVFTLFVAGSAWMSYRSTPRWSRGMLVVGTLLMGVASLAQLQQLVGG